MRLIDTSGGGARTRENPALAGRGRLELRELGEADRAAIEAHFLALDGSDRAARFHACRSDEAIARYVQGIDFRRMLLAGMVEPDGGRIVALAEAHLGTAALAPVAEVSVSVLAERRGEGLGRRAVEHALEACFERGVVRAEFFFTAGNRPLVRLLSALGAEVTLVNGYACIPRPLAAAA